MELKVGVPEREDDRDMASRLSSAVTSELRSGHTNRVVTTHVHSQVKCHVTWVVPCKLGTSSGVTVAGSLPGSPRGLGWQVCLGCSSGMLTMPSTLSTPPR